MKVWASVSVAGIVLTVVLGTWNPRWLKPAWQRRLEDRYSRDQIETFIRVWRQMDRREWGRLIETEEGLEELVRRARGPYWREPTRDELEREMGELEETLAHETGPEMRQHLVRLMKRLKSRLESLEKC
ncbi:MAG: hypothetical protein U9R05_03455 [Chloroflexota bacterium]|nr:hypothetical protein [Chloroflexota bacterium]